MARTGSFGTSLSPFAGLISDLSQYQVAPIAPPPTTPAAPAGPSGPYPGSTDDGRRPGIILPDYTNEPWLDPNGPGLPAGGSWTSPEVGGRWIYTPPPPPERPTVAPAVGVLPVPVVPAPVVPAINYAHAADDVVKMQGYVDILQAVPNPTAAQQAALATDLAQLARNQAAVPAAVSSAAANVAKMQNFVNILQAVPNPTAAQKAALATDLAQLARNQATLASLTGG